MSLQAGPTRTITALLRGGGEAGEVMDRLFPVVYEELRAMARGHVRIEAESPTLNATALVHEAYLKLVDQQWESVRGRGYFFAAASRAMRQVLVDHARRRLRRKRGGGERPLSFEEGDAAVDSLAADLVGLNAALEQLTAIEPRAARVVECRYFAGLSVEETAGALGVSTRTVKRDWILARAWLHRRLAAAAGEDGRGA
jgi:RNA polymerase sigma factor (TIGR02999 family)